jgi:aspartyl-tRNA synthetase
MKRVYNGETPKYLGGKIKVCGWVNTRRDHGGIVFLDLRDVSGIVQAVLKPEIAGDVRPEWVVCLEGIVKERPERMQNPKIATGKIEIEVRNLEILSKVKTLPFAIDTSGYEISEEKRLKYRYLDLRRDRMKRNLQARQQVIHFMREFLIKEGFIEVETPILTKSTPEGARDFLVPARLQPGKFYALPQSPQQYKQLLMIAGLEKYFQIARCLRDEDPRADRQAEHTQLDIEMSFVEQEDILDLVERLYTNLVKKIFPEKKIAKIPFPRITYKTAMEKYKSDKPDLRQNKKNPDELAFAFIVDFPLFTPQTKEDYFYGSGMAKFAPSHHMFTSPKKEDIPLLDSDPLKVKSYQHDFVLNGHEIGGGSIRIHDSKIQNKIFDLIGFTEKQKKQFAHFLKAFEYGVPPHGGIAPGIDRFLSILLNEPNIREVMAFPKTGDNYDLMMDSPSEVTEEQLKELHLKISRKKK